jgi:hypothetical protein
MAVRSPKTESSRSPVYEVDFYRWTEEQARALRERRPVDLDWENVAEEIESLGRSDKRSIESNLNVILVHLLKWRHQREKQTASWKASLTEHRTRIRKLLDESPSLRVYPAKVLPEEYALARVKAAAETGIPEDAFPEVCPFTIDEVLDRTFLPTGSE